MTLGTRRAGLDVVGEIPWGTHMCQFYQTPQDLLDVLVGYFRQGLLDNEFCMWITSEPLGAAEARAALGAVVPDLEDRIRRGQIEFHDYREWYIHEGRFDSARVLAAWVERERYALDRGFEGLRLTGNTFWLEKSDWQGFADYEEMVDSVIGSHRMIAVCTYSLDRCGSFEILDVVRNHQFALIKQQGKWERIESLRHRMVEQAWRREKATVEGINRIFREAFSCETEEDLGRACLGVAEDVTGSPIGFMVELDAENRFRDIAVTGSDRSSGHPGRASRHPRGSNGSGMATLYERVLENSRSYYANDLPARTGRPGLPSDHPRLDSFLCVPLTQSGRTIGLLGLANRPGGYRDEDREAAEALAPAIVQVFTRRRAEEESRRQGEWLRVTLSSIGDAVMTTDTGGLVTYLNPTAEDLTGWSLSDARGLPITQVFKIVDERTLGPGENIVQRVLTAGCRVHLANHLALVARDGRTIPIEDSAAPILDQAGKTAGVVLVFHDVTAKRRAQHALGESEERLRIAVESAEMGTWDYDPLKGTLDWSPRCKAMFGISPEEQIDYVEFLARVHPDDRARIDALVKSALDPERGGRFDAEYRILRADGAERWLVGSWRALFADVDGARRAVRFIGTILDVTERKAAENALRESEAQLRATQRELEAEVAQLEAVLDHLTEGLVVADLEGRLFHWNPAALAMHEFSTMEECRRLLPEFSESFALSAMDGTPLPVEEWPLARILRGEVLRDLEVRVRHLKRGWERIFSYGGKLGRDSGGKPLLAVVSVSDITERRRTQGALAESQADLKRAQAVASTGSWRVDVGGDLVWSDETYRLFGIPQGTPLTYEMFLDRIHPEDREHVDRAWAAALQGAPYDIEHRICVDGKEKWVRERAELERDRNGSLLGGFGTVQDITDRKRTEEELNAARAEAVRDKSRLEAIMETLPVGVAILDARGGSLRTNRAYEGIWAGPRPLTRAVSDYASYRAWWVESGLPVQPEEWASARAVLRGETVTGQFLQIERFDGSRAFVLNAAAPVLDERGEITGCAVAIMDITVRVQAEEELRKSQAILRSFYDSSNFLMGVAELEGETIHVVHVNEATASFFAASSDEMNARSVTEGMTPNRRLWIDSYRRSEAEGKPVRFEYETHAGGSRHSLAATVAFLGEGSPGRQRFSFVAEDITERKQAEAGLRLLSDVISQLLASEEPEHLVESLCLRVMEHLDCQVFFNFLTQDDGRLRLNAYRGITEDEARDLEWLDHGRSDRGQILCGCVARDGRASVAGDVQATCDPAVDIPRGFGIQAYACHPLLNQGEVIGTLAFGTRTRTAFTEDELALMKAVADHVAIAVQRIRILAALERHARLSESANMAKSQFLASMSHELRTPMNAIVGMTDLALSEELAPSAREYLQTARESADMLLELLNEVLDFSRIEAGRFELESTPFALGSVVEQVIRPLSLRAYEKGLELVYDQAEPIREWLLGDPLRLRQVLMNLVGNAIKFTSKGEIVVRVVAEARTEESITLAFSVTDTGVGIAPEDQERIFALFTQADSSTTREYGGSGLGLAISQRLVNFMGGKIRVESTVGHGSTFSFAIVLPIATGLPGAAVADLPDHDAFRDVSVLLVVDHATNRQALEHILTSWSMRPDSAPDVPSALTKIHQAAASGHPYRLVVAEALMPGIDGFTLAEWLKDDSRLAGKVILMLSASDRQNHPEECRKLRAVSIEKPISRSGLFNVFSQVLGHRLVAPSNGPKAPPLVRPKAERVLHVLLAEDTPANQKLVLHVLGKRGHEIAIAHNGGQAVEMLQERSFDVVLMDVQMPVLDGFQATKAIRNLADPSKATVPIIAMTAHALKGDDQRCLDAGMAAYLSKPIKGDEMIDLVERIARRSPEPPEGRREPSEVFNLAEAIRRCYGNEEMFREAVRCFFKEVEELLPRIRDAIDAGDRKELSGATHKLKGTLIYLAAEPAAAALRTLEDLAASGDIEKAPIAFDEFRSRLDVLMGAVVSYRKA